MQDEINEKVVALSVKGAKLTAAVYGEQYRKWSYDSLPILPQEWQYTVAADKGKQFKILKDLMHRADVSEVVNACDAGREGELIFRFVYEMAGCKKPFTRLWISSMETGAIKCGFENLKDGRGYDALYHSALCRAKADWLIGINATRLFSCLYGKTLNVGRVQTPTLKMLVDRDAAITNFKKETYYHVRLMLPGAEAASAKICVADEASRLKAACEASAAVCTSLVKEKKTIAPPKLFDLTSLQREANRIYGYTAKQTLDLAQALYEKKLLTYPRTDSAFLTDDMGETATGIIKVLCEKLSFMEGADFSPEIAKVLNSKKVSDHHAIIPTMELAKTDLTTLPESERNILILTGARLLMATAEPHVYEAVTAVFSCADHEFTARGKTVIAAGWKNIERLYRATLKKKPDSDDEENELALDVPDFTEGQTFEKVYNTAANYKRVLQYDPLLKGAIRKNLLTERIDIVKPLGWYRDSPTFFLFLKCCVLYLQGGNAWELGDTRCLDCLCRCFMENYIALMGCPVFILTQTVIAHAVKQSIKLPPLRGLLGVIIRKEKLVYRNMITSNKVIENLQARLLSLVLDIRKIARGYIERVAYRFAALSVFFSRGFYGCPERLKVI